jgi:peptide-methionine (S)-S-oxide reductase
MFFQFRKDKSEMPDPRDALAGRVDAMRVNPIHHHLGTRIVAPFPDGTEKALFGLGCFWGAERVFWRTRGVYSTAVGYAGGYTPNPTYEEVCSGKTGHNEVVQVVYDPGAIRYADLLKIFFEAHDPTQGMRQGNDVGTQYRSGIYVHDAVQRAEAEAARDAYQAELIRRGLGPITTEIVDAPEFFYAEDYHQGYLSKNPGGYCGLGGTGIACPVIPDQAAR